MGQLILHDKENLLELDGFLLQTGDQVELCLFGTFIPGTIAHNQRGWYFLTSFQVGIRHQTGLLVHLCELATVATC